MHAALRTALVSGKGDRVLSFVGGLPAGVAYGRAGAATAANASGLFVAFAENVAPITDRGLLIEEARTNLFPAAADPSNGNWATASATKTANAAVAPDGTNRAAMFTNTIASGRFRSLSLSTTLASIYAGSIFVKNVDAVASQLVIYDGASVFAARAVLNWMGPVLASVTAGSQPPISVGFVDVGGGWYRVWITAEATATAEQLLFYIDSPATDRSVLLWGAQLELGAFPSSPILTTTAAATRGQPTVTTIVPPGRTGWRTTHDDGSVASGSGLTPGAVFDIRAALASAGKIGLGRELRTLAFLA